jgi:DNA replication licensing factor MCM5
MQELPEMVPTGEMPRHMLLSCDRSLCDKVVPGTRCTIIGIYSIFQAKAKGSASPVRQPYLRVTGIGLESSGSGRMQTTFTPDEEAEMIAMSRDPEIYDRVWKSIAPSIWGNENIKKATCCLLFGGSAKRLPDGTRLRGDINVLVLGDPGSL